MTPTERDRAERAFARALLAAPHDAALRLVYADWLEEHGRAEKADLVRESQGWKAHVFGYCATFSRPIPRGVWDFMVGNRDGRRYYRKYPVEILLPYPHYNEFRVRPDGTSPDDPENWAWLLSLALDHGLALPGLDAPEAADGR